MFSVPVRSTHDVQFFKLQKMKAELGLKSGFESELTDFRPRRQCCKISLLICTTLFFLCLTVFGLFYPSIFAISTIYPQTEIGGGKSVLLQKISDYEITH
jgi:hypothetical protein